MAKTSEPSVLANLNDLFEMEADRRAEEAAAKERAKAAEAARLEAEQRAREEAIAAARDEERRRAEQRAEEERARRDSAVEDRLRALRAELAEVRAAREQVQRRVEALAARPEEGASRRGSWLAGGMAAISLVAALTATAVAWPQSSVSMAQVEATTEVEEPAEPVAEAREIEVETPEVEAAEVTPDAPEPVAVADAPAVRRPRTPRPPRPRTPVEDDLSRELDLGDDDAVLSDDFLRGAGR